MTRSTDPRALALVAWVLGCTTPGTPSPPMPLPSVVLQYDCLVEGRGRCDAHPPVAALEALGDCSERTAPPLCEDVLRPSRASELGARIDRMQARVLDRKYQDVDALVELSRLQLWRGDSTPSSDGASDLARSLRNAQRAVAVDPSAPSARFALALALVADLQRRPSARDAATRGAVHQAERLALAAVPSERGALGAAARTLAGMIALDEGDELVAMTSFDSALARDDHSGSAWLGKGEVLRSAGDFGAADAAFQRAAQQLPFDLAPRRALEASSRRVELRLALAPPAPVLALTSGPLATPRPDVPSCPGAPTKGQADFALCHGLLELASASRPDDIANAAQSILDQLDPMAPLCEASDPICGPHVYEAYDAAVDGLLRAHRTAKSIAAARLVLSRGASGPAAAGRRARLRQVIADGYYELAAFDQAASFYEQSTLELKRGAAADVVDRTVALQVVLADAAGARRLATSFGDDPSYAPERRSRWVLAAAAVTRATEGPAAAGAFLEGFRGLLRARAPLSSEASALSVPAAPALGDATLVCGLGAACATRRLASEPGWSRAARD